MKRRFALDVDGKQEIEVKTGEATLHRLLEQVQRSWKKLGEEAPHWSVVTRDEFRPDQFHAHQEEFWRSGEGDVQRFFIWAARNGIPVDPGWTCPDYGCGAGRSTAVLAQRFSKVIGCDVSAPHMALAARRLKDQRNTNVEFILVNSLAALDSLPPVDLIFSVIVLQHNPPPVIVALLERLLMHLRPGGVAYFRAPTRARGYIFKVDDYLRDRENKLEMEMHVIPQKGVFEILRRAGCELIEVQPDNMTGSLDFISNTFLVRKLAPERGEVPTADFRIQ
ncbi:MAG: class I SAM-dependent methyltransferase [Bryobacteraceae bacterium]|nr:class I SAM-dependent methyltransferase [Bryobacterales bacterium]MEB2362184.1 class I SAM-dependent methyltransferase [Bryobacterales bacterium]NUM99803.1 class I SAM-dependent methyltransferase [Bryobacteraceae bacterium]